MRAARERAVAHAALLSVTDKDRLLDRWAYEELLATAIEFTKPRPSWWRRWQTSRVKRRAERRWPA